MARGAGGAAWGRGREHSGGAPGDLGGPRRRAAISTAPTTSDPSRAGAATRSTIESWGRTFHRTMTTEATPANVRGDFSGATLVARGGRGADGSRRGGRLPDDLHDAGRGAAGGEGGAGGRVATVPAVPGGRGGFALAVAGRVPRRGEAVVSDDRRVSVFRRLARQRRTSPGPRYGGGVFDRHVTRWNDNCVFCHNVAPNPGRDPATGAFSTTVAELGIACEACHGPGRGARAAERRSGAAVRPPPRVARGSDDRESRRA